MYINGALVATNTNMTLHPSSLGATSVQGQASVLQLWDPDRSQAARRRAQPATRAQLAFDLNEALDKLGARRGSGLRLLAGSVTQPANVVGVLLGAVHHGASGFVLCSCSGVRLRP